jgi:hypothetical protein
MVGGHIEFEPCELHCETCNGMTKTYGNIDPFRIVQNPPVFDVKALRVIRVQHRSNSMHSFTRVLAVLVTSAVFAGPAIAAEAIAAGKIKSVSSDKKEFVLTDTAGKDWTFKLGDNMVINRGGQETQNELNAGDPVNVCYDKGVLHWTANYILVQEGDTKTATLVHGTVKNYDPDKKQVTFTDSADRDHTYSVDNAKVKLNKLDSRIADVKIGDNALAIVEAAQEGSAVKSLMIDRK